MDMGLGKTVTILSHVTTIQGRTLVVAPKRVAESVWSDEVDGWEHLQGTRVSVVAGTAKQRVAALNVLAKVYTISYENLIWLCEQGYAGMFDTLVMDEISYMKNTRSGRFKAFRKYIKQFKRRYGLTGTPVPNRLLDLFGVTFMIDGGERFGRAITPFKEKWFEPRDYMRYDWHPKDGTEQWMFEQLADISYRIPAEGYVDLPRVVEKTIQVALPPDVRAVYDDLEKNMFIELDGTDASVMVESAAGMTNKLQQVAQGFVYGDAEDDATYRLHDQKLIALQEIADELEGQPLIIAYTYQADLAVLRDAFPEACTLDDENAIKRWNRGEIEVLLMHPKSGAHGLNLQFGGHHICLFGLNWSMELYQQLIRRLARPGQASDHVVVMRIVAQGTIDEAIQWSVVAKEGRQERFLDAVFKYREERAA
jgi:hypothetical protein